MGMETSPSTSDLNMTLPSMTLVQWPVKRSPFFRITTSARAATAIDSMIRINQKLGLMRASRSKLGLGSIVLAKGITSALRVVVPSEYQIDCATRGSDLFEQAAGRAESCLGSRARGLRERTCGAASA